MGSAFRAASGGMDPSEVARALEGDTAYERGKSPIRAAPAHGLTLEKVYYDEY
jgi:tRNA U38,U39,U40 pseudouridine synthase TruA